MLKFLDVVESDEASGNKIVRDRRTGVNYFCSCGDSDANTLYPLFGFDGMPLITDENGEIRSSQLFDKHVFCGGETIVNTSGKTNGGEVFVSTRGYVVS